MSKGGHTRTSYAFSLLRVCMILAVALIFPRFFVGESHTAKPTVSLSSFRLGLENISDSFLKSLSPSANLSYKVGLVTNHMGVDQRGKRNIDVLRERGLTITKVYIPSHCLSSYEQIGKYTDSTASIPLVRFPTAVLPYQAQEYSLNDIDVLFVDVQDLGVRPNKCVEMMELLLKSAVRYQKKIVILDRPTLFGSTIEGITMGKEDNQEVALPLQYGMTIGELARYINTYSFKGAASLYVVPMAHYERTMAPDTVLSHQFPLMTNIDTSFELNFLEVLAHIEPLDVGVGTDMALRCVLLPDSLHLSKQKWYELRVVLKSYGVETALCHNFNAKRQQRYTGLRLSVTNMENFSSFNTLLAIVQFFKAHGIRLSFSAQFDEAIGSKKVREFLEGKISREMLEVEVNKGLKTFFTRAQRSFIYKPYPRVTFL